MQLRQPIGAQFLLMHIMHVYIGISFNSLNSSPLLIIGSAIKLHFLHSHHDLFIYFYFSFFFPFCDSSIKHQANTRTLLGSLLFIYFDKPSWALFLAIYNAGTIVRSKFRSLWIICAFGFHLLLISCFIKSQINLVLRSSFNNYIVELFQILPKNHFDYGKFSPSFLPHYQNNTKKPHFSSYASSSVDKWQHGILILIMPKRQQNPSPAPSDSRSRTHPLPLTLSRAHSPNSQCIFCHLNIHSRSLFDLILIHLLQLLFPLHSERWSSSLHFGSVPARLQLKLGKTRPSQLGYQNSLSA